MKTNNVYTHFTQKYNVSKINITQLLSYPGKVKKCPISEGIIFHFSYFLLFQHSSIPVRPQKLIPYCIPEKN